MATKQVILTPSGVTVADVSSGYSVYSMPDAQVTRCIMPWSDGVPEDFYAFSSVELIILTEQTGNLYLRPGTNRFDGTTPGTLDSSTGSYAAYAGGTADSKAKFITLPSAMWSSLADTNAGDVFNFVIDRDATSVLDTYNVDLNVIGVRVTYELAASTGTHYCTQTDLEWRISQLTLAQLTNDTTGATTPDANVLESLLTNVDAIIDSKAGQVYTVPFSPVPDIIKNIAISLACYQVFQRRPVGMAMPADWQKAYEQASQQLEDISNMLLRLPDTATIASAESNMVTSTTDPVVDFYNADNDMSVF